MYRCIDEIVHSHSECNSNLSFIRILYLLFQRKFIRYVCSIFFLLYIIVDPIHLIQRLKKKKKRFQTQSNIKDSWSINIFYVRLKSMTYFTCVKGAPINYFVCVCVWVIEYGKIVHLDCTVRQLFAPLETRHSRVSCQI